MIRSVTNGQNMESVKEIQFGWRQIVTLLANIACTTAEICKSCILLYVACVNLSATLSDLFVCFATFYSELHPNIFSCGFEIAWIFWLTF